MRPLCLALTLAASLAAQSTIPADLLKMGHSHRGDAFDTGPREKPWVIEGIGKSHFPITTSNPEVQKWFDQGHTLLHSFWFYEAERSFRWCLKLEPDNAMAWWGMARANDENPERSVKFIKEAAKRKSKVTERERLYIEAWEAALVEDPLSDAKENDRQRKYKELLEQIVLKYPDDIEAKSMYVLATMWESGRASSDAMLKQIIAVDPRHPGAHHYRIHNWNYRNAEQALDSCRLYGEIAPGIGHAQHMPGHIYATVGMWQEAAISMDAATRVEKQYMRTRMIFPWDDWNYAHNANYLSFIQTQLGMAEASISGAKQLVEASLDPQFNKSDGYVTHWQGMLALMRALIRFERWQTILDPKTFGWMDNPRDKAYRAYCETIAQIGLGNLEKAEQSVEAHSKLKTDLEKPEYKSLDETYQTQRVELRGRLALARGDALEGIGALTEAARRERKLRDQQNDPPFYPVVVSNVLGRAYLDQKSPHLAVTAYQSTLDSVRSDGFALAGMVEAYTALGEKDKARDAMGQLLSVWGDADPGLRDLERARSMVTDAKPIDKAPAPQRNYRTMSLASLGPNMWEPYAAPKLETVDSKGKRVTLDEYKGKNVMLIFYLGEECPHCLEQLVEVSKRKGDWSKLDTEVLAISSAAAEKNSGSSKLAELPFRLLSDSAFANARRFKSYDDFEDLELHSTILIDKKGRVHWARTGGDPFTDFTFLEKELERMNAAMN
jgi:peroxiredoxin